jgi:hypothetical protein
MNSLPTLSLPAISSRLLPVAAIAAATLFIPLAPAQSSDLEVGVRASVTETSHLWSKDKLKTPGDGGHGKVYAIFKVDLVKSNQRLTKPVDEKYVTSLLMNELDANGFKQFVPGQAPDFLITMSYGRGELTNPYIRDQGEVGGLPGLPAPGAGAGGGPQSASAPQQTITGAMPMQLFDEKTPGWEAKLQKASFEKLYIRVTAWSYPTKAQPKPIMLWKTVMVVDDPDHRDLNAVAAKMLEAGAPYFDKLPRDREIEVHKPLPEGHVKVGDPEVYGKTIR